MLRAKFWPIAILAVPVLAFPLQASASSEPISGGAPSSSLAAQRTVVLSSGSEESNVVAVRPRGPVEVGNCIPFGNNTGYGFTGFVYRNIPPFELERGGTLSFDLGQLNGQQIRRNIYLAATNKNPGPALLSDINVVSQNVRAERWVRVVSDSQVPSHPRGDTVLGNFELTYRAEQAFDFRGGGLAVGFGASPPGRYADVGCEQVLVATTSHDPSGRFYARFCNKVDRTAGRLDAAGTCGGTAVAIGGVVIRTEPDD